MAKTSHTDKEGFLKLFRLFMKESGNGKRLKKDGKKIRPSTVDNYIYTYKLLERFCTETGFDLKFIVVSKSRKRDFESAKKYWKKFYLEFTNYMYKDLDYYDNYVGLVIKSLRTFFNYVKEEKNIDIGSFHKTFYVPKEEVAIIALAPEQVNYLIYNTELNAILPAHLHRIRDMFVFGCTVCLRVSDLLAIRPQNIVSESGSHYLRITSQKTGTFTSIKLPDYAMEIIEKYRLQKGATLFPSISKDRFNAALKDMGKYLQYNEPIVKTRTKRGVECIVYKNKAKKQHHTLADMITTHTMRRTGITTMLRMGMPDYLVRKVSGHSANSKEFFRYVQLAQNYLDKHTDDAFEKLRNLV
jgi:integrase